MPSSYANQSITLRLLATSDVHGHFTGYDYFRQRPQPHGLAHLAPVIAQQRATADVALLIDNGDLIQGSPVTDMLVAQHQSSSQLSAPSSVGALLEFMEYDVANLGNHEFNYGLDYLRDAYWNKRLGTQHPPLLSANLHARSEYAKRLLQHKPFHIFSYSLNLDSVPRELRIAVVGVLPPQIMQWDAHHLSGHVEVSSMLESTRSAVQQAKQAGADIIVVVAHTGMPKHSNNGIDAEQGVWQLAQIADIDAIIFGHQHELFPGSEVYRQLAHVNSENGTIFAKPAVQPGSQGTHLGVIDLVLSYHQSSAGSADNAGWQVVKHNSQVIAAAPTPDAKVTTFLSAMHEATQLHMQQPIGYSAHNLSLEFARTQPTHALQFIHSAQLWYAKRFLFPATENVQSLPIFSAVAPFNAALNEDMSKNKAFTFIPQGVVSLGDIGNLYRYPNTLDVVKVNGLELKQWLEQSAAALKPATKLTTNSPWQRIDQSIPSYQFDTFSGFTYQIDTNMPVGKRVSANISFAANAHYYVVTNNYRANGGGNFARLDGSQIIGRAPDQIQHILVRYLEFLGEQGYRAELDNNWQVH